jgi:hypothetical protein
VESTSSRSRPRRRVVATIAATASLIAIGACSGDDSQTSGSAAATSVHGSVPVGDRSGDPSGTPSSSAESPPDRGPVELGPLASTDLDVDTGDGRVQLGDDADVPDLVPSSFPVPDDLDVQLATETGAAAGFSGVTAVPLDDLVSFYLAELAAAGWTAETRQAVADTATVISFTGDAGSGEVAIAQAPGGGRSVLVTFQP